MIDKKIVYRASIDKLENFTRRERDDLRKLVLLNNFVYDKFGSPVQDDDLLEWSDEDIKKDEESWLDSCLGELEDDYVYVNKPFELQPTVTSFTIDRYDDDDPRHYDDHYVQDNNNNAMDYETLPHEQQFPKVENIIDDVIIPQDPLHLPFFDSGDNYQMDIDEQDDDDDDDDDYLMNTFMSNDSSSQQQDDDVNMTEIENSSENLTTEKGFHPYWKDNSIISNFNTRSFGIPKIFHKYRFGQDDDDVSRIGRTNVVLELLQSDYLYQSLESPLKRSKDDLDILYSLTPKDLDRGVLMDMISMLEYYGSKTNNNNHKSNSSEVNNDNIWFMDNNHR